MKQVALIIIIGLSIVAGSLVSAQNGPTPTGVQPTLYTRMQARQLENRDRVNSCLQPIKDPHLALEWAGVYVIDYWDTDQTWDDGKYIVQVWSGAWVGHNPGCN